MKTEILPYLLAENALLVGGLSIISWFIHKSVPTRLNKIFFHFWLLNAVNLVISAVASSSDKMYVSLMAISLWPFMINLFKDMLKEFSPTMKDPPISLYVLMGIGYAASFFIAIATSANLTIASSPAIYSLGFFGLYICWTYWKSKKIEGAGILEKMALLLFLSFIIHLMDWPFVRMNEKWVMIGYAYYLFNLVGFAAVFPALGLKLASEIKEKELSELVQSRTEALLYQSRFTALGEMAAGVAHEINNPLMIIMGRLTFAKRGLQDEHPNVERIYHEVMLVEKSSERISQIVKGLTKFAKGDPNEPFKHESIRSLIENVQVLCKEKIKLEEIEINLAGDVDAFVLTRGPQISHVFYNLMSNAFEAMEKTEHKVLNISAHLKESNAVIEFSNSGVTIPESVRHKIMQPFFTTKEVGKGTGLGLSISQGIVKEHYGELYLDESKPQTTFVVELPTFQEKEINKIQ